MGFFFQLTLNILLVVIALMKDVLNDHTPKTQICIDANAVDEKEILVSGSVLQLFQKSSLWLDKSLLIKYMIENKDKIHIITCPTESGKTMNLMLMKMFFEVPITWNGELVTRENSFGFKYFKEGVILPESGTIVKRFHTISMNGTLTINGRPLIGQYDELMDNHFGRYPVIYFSFYDMNPRNWKISFGDRIEDAFKAHQYLKKQWDDILMNSSSNSAEKQDADLQKERFYNFTHTRFVDTVDELTLGLVHLIKLLNKWHKRPVLFLIDKYDHLFNEILTYPKAYKIEDVTQSKRFLSKFYNSLAKEFADEAKEAGLLYKVVLTGRLRIPQCDQLSRMNPGKTEYNFINMQNLTDFYGVDVDTELKYLAQEGLIEHLKEYVIEYYDGFRQLNMPMKKQLSIYATTFFINHRKIDNIAALSCIHSFLYQLLTYHPKFAKVLNDLINKYSLYYSIPYKTIRKIDEQFYTRMHELIEIDRVDMELITNDDIANVMGILTMLGYMTLKENHTYIPATDLNDDTNIHIVIPNYQTKKMFQKHIKEMKVRLILRYTHPPIVSLHDFLMADEHEDELKHFQLFDKSIKELFRPQENKFLDLLECYKDGYYLNNETTARIFFDDILKGLTNNQCWGLSKYSLVKEVTYGKLKRSDLILTSKRNVVGLISKLKYDNAISINRILLQTKDYTRTIPKVRVIKYLAVAFYNDDNGTKVIKLEYDTKNKKEIDYFINITTDRNNASNETELLTMLEHYKQTDESSVYKILKKYRKSAYYPLFAAYHIRNIDQLFDLKLPDFLIIFGRHNSTASRFQNLITNWGVSIESPRILKTERQKKLLKDSYKKNRMPTSDDIELLAESTGLEKNVVQQWFYNARKTDKSLTTLIPAALGDNNQTSKSPS